MWSYVKIPNVPGESSQGVVCLEKYYVKEGEEIKKGERLALAHTERVSFNILSNYDGRILKVILPERTMVGFRDPIATLELLEDPVDGLLIEYCELLDVA
jgi:pyruvate/2-oxoglutarate dehydrogenase complex dihydrolipoamide acyltransferase (E2) component